jgi:hypothetical protein
MKQLLVPALLGVALMGAGCPFTKSEPKAPAAQEKVFVLPDGQYRTNNGHTDRVRNVKLVNAQGGKVASPLIISGEARLWYFEATFPVGIVTEGMQVAGLGRAEADGDWMTEDWVPFTAEIEFNEQPAGSKGKLILQADNPSGLPENDDHIEIPITF